MTFANPYRPGAGHQPPYLAGRTKETAEFRKLLEQTIILENAILTGLRGVGKTVLLEQFKPIAKDNGWLWVGSDISEASSISEDNLATRIITDLSVVTSSVTYNSSESQKIGFGAEKETIQHNLDYGTLRNIYDKTPGLVSDKLKAVLEVVWEVLKVTQQNPRVVFAYDEAQNFADQAHKEQFPLSLLLDVFQSIQKKNIPFMLVLTGLPTLYPKLVDARTYAERMFHVIFLNQLTEDESKEAILKPIKINECPVIFTEDSVSAVYDMSGGYPYFIQFICREVFDVWTVNPDAEIPTNAIVEKLDQDFFVGRWARATDRQRELLTVIANLDSSDDEFTVQEVVQKSKGRLEKSFSGSHVTQMLSSLSQTGLVYKNRHGKYTLAVPLLGRFIRRQSQ